MMCSRVSIGAVVVLSLLWGCADHRVSPAMLAREGLTLVASDDRARGRAPSQSNARESRSKPPASATPSNDSYATEIPTRTEVQGAAPPSATTPDQCGVTVSATATHEMTVTAGAPHTYVVKRGDTLFKIAQQFYGDGNKWTNIRKANPRIKDPDQLRIGERLTIPG